MEATAQSAECAARTACRAAFRAAEADARASAPGGMWLISTRADYSVAMRKRYQANYCNRSPLRRRFREHSSSNKYMYTVGAPRSPYYLHVSTQDLPVYLHAYRYE